MTLKDSRTKRTALNAFASLVDNLIRLIIKFAQWHQLKDLDIH